ncbi:MAG: TonB-dependent receptor [Proteobacteria bacterium]|nr:TonB-dependent receptor [Pseudomonadota bacterium]
MRNPSRAKRCLLPLQALAVLAALFWAVQPHPARGQDADSHEEHPGEHHEEPHEEHHEGGQTSVHGSHGSHDPIDEIVVSASPLGRGAADTPTAVNVVSREHLLAHGGSTLGEILANEPGVTTSGLASGASRPVIRGQSGFRVKTTENGLGTADVAAIGPDHGVPVNPLMAQSIEVLRGPATLRYGGAAIGGGVNALIDRVPSRAPTRGVSGELLGDWGSGADRRKGSFLVDAALGRLGLHLDGATQRAEDYKAPGGTGPSKVRNSGTDGFAMSGGLASLGEGLRLGLARSRFDNQYGVPEDAHIIDLRKDVWHMEADWSEPIPGLTSIELRGALGAHYNRRELQVLGLGDTILEPSRTDTWALYAIEEWLLSDRLNLELAARVERVEVRGSLPGMARRSQRFHPFSASLGLVYYPTDGVSLALRASSTERAPDPAELYYLGEHHATGTYEIGDPDLGVERADAAELTLHVQRGRFSLTAGLFYTDSRTTSTWLTPGASWCPSTTTATGTTTTKRARTITNTTG